MSWTPLSNTPSDFSRAAQSVIAAFQGRSATLTASSFFGVAVDNLSVQFVDQSSSRGGAVVAWAWTFGDGNSSTEQNPSHTYAAAGSYLVTLVITDASGLQGSRSVTVTAIADVPDDPEDPIIPVAKFSASTLALTATFTDLSTDSDGTVVAWNWDFGERPTSAFSETITGLSVLFTDQSTAPAPLTVSAWSWDFGDAADGGDTSGATLQSPTHVYASGGGKDVTLKVTASNAQTNTLTRAISLTSNPSGSTGTLGIPFGMSNSFIGTATLRANLDHFNMFRSSDAPSAIVDRINWARTNNKNLMLAMTGGEHTNYLTNGIFDRSKWNAKQDTFNTAAIKSAIAAGVWPAGPIRGASVMDEPHHAHWGPSGTMTKAKIDDMARYVKNIFPTLPVGVDHASVDFQRSSSYTIIDYIWASYSARVGPVVVWRDDNLSMCARDHHQVVFGFNILSSGDRINGCTTSEAVCCPEPQTQGSGGVGAGGMFCRPSATKIKSMITTLGPFGAGFMIWWWDSETMVTGAYQADNQSAFSFGASTLSVIPAKAWRRTD